MKKLLSILILLLLTGCAGQGGAPVSQASPAATEAQTAAATAAPTARQEQRIAVDAPREATATPRERPTPSPSPTAAPTLSPSPTPSPSPTAKPLAGVVVGLDPGHQRNSDLSREPLAPGSEETKFKVAEGCQGVNSGVYEYEVNLNVALHLRDMLAEAGAAVVMTHDTLDVNISNVQRARVFNEAKVDLGLRLHCNKGGSSPKFTGAYMMVPKRSRTRFFDENVRAAKAILAAYCAETGLSCPEKTSISYRDDQAGFNWCKRPVVCIEMGYLSNPADDALLSDPAFQVTMARGLFNGILQYFRPDLAEAVHE